MKKSVYLALTCTLAASLVLANEPDRAELLGNRKLVEGAGEPAFSVLTVEQLLQQLKVLSSRSHAVFGFNNSVVRIHLPRCDNSVYASVEFSPARVVDGGGGEVPYERERGIYDHDTHSDELRIAPAAGDAPVEFARVDGTVTLRYPVRMKTVGIRVGGQAPAGMAITVDGPFVSWSDPEESLPEAADFTPVAQLRALDSSGQQLERHPFKGYSMSGGVSTNRYAYWGEVAEIRLDLVEEWAEVEATYSLPAIDPLPAASAGTPPERAEVLPTPGGNVEFRIVEAKAAGAEAPGATMSKAEALAQLKELGFRRFDANSFILAATRGKAEALRLFLAGGMPVDAESGGRTALLMAATMGQVEAGKVLIEAGADVNQTDSTGSTPLGRVVMQCRATELLSALIDAGADLTAELPGGISLRKMAEVSNCSGNASVLKEAGAQ